MSIKSKIKKNFWGRYLICELHCAESWIMPKIISDERAVRTYYKSKTGNDLDLENPMTFTEKLNWYKLTVRDPLMQDCADKYAVREYVKNKGYSEILNGLIGVYNSANEIDFSKLPEHCVIKATHGSHMNLIIRDKKSINWKKEKILLNGYMRQSIYWAAREWVYKDIPHKLIVEEYLEDNSGSLMDYKFYCFHGMPKYIDVDCDRFTSHFRNYYDMDWNLLDLQCSFVPNNPRVNIKKPEQFKKMVEIARALSEPFQFVRVDLYVVKDKVLFGELTFYQDGGFPGYPYEYDKMIGDYWHIQ